MKFKNGSYINLGDGKHERLRGLKTWQKYICPTCKKEFDFDIPYVGNGYVGFKVSDHGCGENTAAVITPASEEKKSFWKKVFE